MAENVQEKCLSLLGIKAFHEAGYTGKNVKIMSDEKVYKNEHGDVISPKGFQSSSGSWHGSCVMDYLKLIAPNATFIAYPFGGSFSANSYNSPCAEYIKSEKVHVFTTSQTGSASIGKQKAMQDCIKEANTVFCAAAGNEGSKGLRPESKMATYLAIGGVKFKSNCSLEKLERVNYSSYGKELDYMTITEIPVNPNYDSGALGTSFCSPVFAGMIGLVQDFFIQKTGNCLSYDKVIEFINDNTIDLQEQGFDIYTGYGLFILPNPLTINIKKYCPNYVYNVILPTEEQTKEETDKQESIVSNNSNEIKEENNNNTIIELYIDKKYMYINGVVSEMDTAPFIKNGRTFVPIKFISEALGHDVEWDGVKQKVTIK